MIASPAAEIQPPLISIYESDDIYLGRQEQLFWFQALRDLDWLALRPFACQYYEALWRFNEAQAQERASRALAEPKPNAESRSEAAQRLLFGRPIMDFEAEVLVERAPEDLTLFHVDPERIRPGVTPPRWAGRKPKCFFAMFKAFLGLAIRGRVPEPEQAHDELSNNPAYARACGFTLPEPGGNYRHSDIPSLRKLQQFDQILTQERLWEKIRVEAVARNLREGNLSVSDTVVHDTTDYPANSERVYVETGGVDSKGRAESRSCAKTTKNCRCENRDLCPHEWVSADDGAGIVVKSTGRRRWGHKASTLSFDTQEIPLDAVAMNDAASHDSNSLLPQLDRVFEHHCELRNTIHRVLDDSAADSAPLKEEVFEKYGIELLTPQNPRARKPIASDLPRGVEEITRYGIPTCRAGYPMDFLGCRHTKQHFLFRAPNDEKGKPVCLPCELREECCRRGGRVRHVSIPFDRLPWIDPDFPQISRRFARVMAKRTVIERIHKKMKFDFGDERLSKRGTAAFQARLDKTLLAMHVVLSLQ